MTIAIWHPADVMRALRAAAIALLLVTVPTLTGCPENDDRGATGAKVYECPMRCVPEGKDEPHTQAEPGKCPVCGMDLVERR